MTAKKFIFSKDAGRDTSQVFFSRILIKASAVRVKEQHFWEQLFLSELLSAAVLDTRVAF